MNNPPADVFLLIIDYSLPIISDEYRRQKKVNRDIGLLYDATVVRKSMSWVANLRCLNRAWRSLIDNDEENTIVWYHVARNLGLDPPKHLYAGGNYQEVCQSLLHAEEQRANAIKQVDEMTRNAPQVACGMRRPPRGHPDHPHKEVKKDKNKFIKLPQDVKDRIANNAKALHDFLNSVNFSVTTKLCVYNHNDVMWHEGAFLRYQMFLLLKSKYPDVWMVPTVDIEFCWLSHIFRTECYWSDMKALGIEDPSHSLCMKSYGEIASFSNAVDGTVKLWNKEFGPDYPYISVDTDTSVDLWKAEHLDLFRKPELVMKSPNRFLPRMGIMFPKPPPDTNLPNISLSPDDIHADLSWFPELRKAFGMMDINSYDVMRYPCRDRGELIKCQVVPSYERFLNLCDKSSESYAPPVVIDLVWHAHQLEPVQYKEDCLQLFGHEFHHNPWPKGLGVMNEISNEFKCSWKTEYGTPIEEDWKYYNSR